MNDEIERKSVVSTRVELSKVLDDLRTNGKSVIVQKNYRDVAAIIPMPDFQKLQSIKLSEAKKKQ